MKRNLYKQNFDRLVQNLRKYCLDCNALYGSQKYPKCTYFSKKYNSYISERTVYAGQIAGLDYNKKQMDYFRNEISEEEFKNFHDKFIEQNPWFPEIRLDGKFRVFVYLENNNFCLDIEENKVRTKLVEIPVPEKIIGDHNGDTAWRFEQCINRQIDKYLRQKHTNIDIIRALPE